MRASCVPYWDRDVGHGLRAFFIKGGFFVRGRRGRVATAVSLGGTKIIDRTELN